MAYRRRKWTTPRARLASYVAKALEGKCEADAVGTVMPGVRSECIDVFESLDRETSAASETVSRRRDENTIPPSISPFIGQPLPDPRFHRFQPC